jgi:hypothetical protein
MSCYKDELLRWHLSFLYKWAVRSLEERHLNPLPTACRTRRCFPYSAPSPLLWDYPGPLHWKSSLRLALGQVDKSSLPRAAPSSLNSRSVFLTYLSLTSRVEQLLRSDILKFVYKPVTQATDPGYATQYVNVYVWDQSTDKTVPVCPSGWMCFCSLTHIPPSWQ